MPYDLPHVLRGRQHQKRPLRVALVLLALLIILSKLAEHRAVVINTSPSVSPGLYVRSSVAPAVGQIVDFCIPPAARNYVSARTGDAGENWYILKPIAAGPGDRVYTLGDWLVINGQQIGPMPPISDREGRPLPRWRDNRLLGPDEFFVFSDRIANSFDSRCYGPIKRSEIASVRRPLLTW